MHNDGRVLLAILNSYVRNEIRVATVIQSLIACSQSIAASTQKLPDSAVQSVSTARLRQSIIRRNYEVIDQSEVSRGFFTCNEHER